jgi:hypothetical protein
LEKPEILQLLGHDLGRQHRLPIVMGPQRVWVWSGGGARSVMSMDRRVGRQHSLHGDPLDRGTR